MSFEFDFSRDAEFTKLLARRSDVDLTVTALELARDAWPQLDFSEVMQWIRTCAGEVRHEVHRAHSERAAVEIVANNIVVGHGIAGDKEAFADPDGSFLNCVIAKRRGIPISLSILHMAVCRELGIDLQGVAAPRHFLTRIDAPEGPLFLDAFGGCRILTQEAALAWLEEITAMPKRDIARHLQPVGVRPIVTRMLNNLKVLYAEKQHWTAAWRVQCRLTALNPAEYAERRDLALVALKANHTGLAIRLLKSVLNSCPENDREMLERHLQQAEGQLHQWN